MDSDMVEIRGENEEEEDEDEEEEEGPPPGFNCITSGTQQEAAMEAEKYGDEDNEEEEEEEEDDDDDEGPPPGWSPIPPFVQPRLTSDVEMLSKEEADEDEDELPPGWHLPQSTVRSAEAVPELENNQEDDEDQEEGPPPGWESISPLKQTPLTTKTLPPPSIPVTEVGRKQEDKCRDEGAQAGVQSAAPPPYKPVLPTPASLPCASASFTEKGQMICGSCRRLLSYHRGAKHVKCSCCQTVNLVLEAHQIGQVKCGSCAVLLMYSYGAPAVRCSSCRHVTEIGAHNKRPPLSVQQERRLPSFSRVH